MIPLEDLQVYKIAMEIGDAVWSIVEKWNYYQKDTLGKQFTKASDSISFNISEGYGRFHFAENRNFCFYSRGSHLREEQPSKRQTNGISYRTRKMHFNRKNETLFYSYKSLYQINWDKSKRI